ncbi:MAG: HDOD domain-containing protein [Candidatus Accumulibacter sp.]|uniref:HDOD domain-containing protein n=1 Tax=Accumulibacter sp. TaxID=2053492 RepID=UPI00287A7E90|nr:HDOD domain-containing protein [Accumulibacter sp.]MDS4012896.1 HDOD domain-containing protein [Accumulibacter sp.]
MPTAEQLVASNVTLVTLPEVFARVKQVVDDPRATTIDLARVISADPGVSARILKLINSAFWGFSGRIDSLARAVSLLGMLHVHDLVLATAVVGTFQRIRPELMDVARFWRGSIFRSLAATALARHGQLVDLGRVFTEALLSDLGHLIIYLKAPKLAAQALEQTRATPWQLAEAERALIGCDYAEVGGTLTDCWQLPQCFGEAIRCQNEPRKAQAHALEASLLNIAGMLDLLRSSSLDSPTLLAHIDPFAWETTGLDPACAAQILAEAKDGLSATALLFGVPNES